MKQALQAHMYARKQNRTIDNTNYTIDGYDATRNYGVILQTKPINKQTINSMEQLLELDWIFDVSAMYMRKIEVGNYILCEIVPEWTEAIQTIRDNVFLYTGKNEWIWLSNRSVFTLECESQRRTAWIGEICTFQDVLRNTCLKHTLTKEGKQVLRTIDNGMLECSKIAYARCEESMHILDTIHRYYVNTHNFLKNQIVAIQSVAGSGKTTTLLNLAKIHKDKRILYIAFNKSLILEIKNKLHKDHIANMTVSTFDSLLYQMYLATKKKDPNIIQLKPTNIANYVPWLQGKPYKVKASILKEYNRFCNDANFESMEDYCISVLKKKKPILEQLWVSTTQGEFHTFENLRKLALVEHWFNPYVDSMYDMIMIDETQDFDMSMLRMLLNDTTIPKLFVGDPKQSIYEFRGCINAFKYLPADALTIEFYSTFRVGEPACSKIRKQFENCWMISKSLHSTILEPFSKWSDPNKSYTYLFRNWHTLLTAAETMRDIWINGYEKKKEEIQTLHKKLDYVFTIDYEDDLPKFLKSITAYELEQIFLRIEENLVEKDISRIQMYTLHSYKGLEDANVRLASDIEREEFAVYYVALTRGHSRILTSMDIEYFEKLSHIKQEQTKVDLPIQQNNVCSCGGCVCAEPSIFHFDTIMGKKSWCILCQRNECSCESRLFGFI